MSVVDLCLPDQVGEVLRSLERRGFQMEFYRGNQLSLRLPTNEPTREEILSTLRRRGIEFEESSGEIYFFHFH